MPVEEWKPPPVEDWKPIRKARRSRPENHPGLAAVLSFLFFGLGQIYNGQIGKGLLLILMQLIFIAASLVFPPVVVVVVLLWLWGIFDAYYSVETINACR